jgi:hypothetical protein
MARLQLVIGVLAAVLVFVTGGSDVARADPDTVTAGHDLLETDSSDTYMDFSANPLPADFFGPGSDPFDGTVYLEGEPFDSFGGFNGLSPTDTIVERKTDAGTESFPDTIDIEIVALELKSVAPITVTYNGGQNPGDWDVTASVPEGDLNQETGSMTIRHEDADGGTFDIDALPVRPKLTFTQITGGSTVVGPLYWPDPPTSSYFVFGVSGEDWCHTANPLAVPPGQVVIEKPGLTTNFFPGIDCGPPRTKGLVVLDDGSSRLSVRAAENAALGPVGGIAALPDVSYSSGRSYVALAGLAAAAAAVALVASGWYARRRWTR